LRFEMRPWNRRLWLPAPTVTDKEPRGTERVHLGLWRFLEVATTQ
jgi:hypothetical protein